LNSGSNSAETSEHRGAYQDPSHWARLLLPTARRLLLEKALRGLPCLDEQCVLVMGAGHDPYHGLFESPDRYICIDIQSVPGVTDVKADALSLPFRDGCFTTVIATECLEHVRDPFLFSQEMTRVLQFEGRLIITVPFLFHEHGDPHDYWRPTRQSLDELFRGYKSVEIRSLGNRAHVIWDLVTTMRPRILFVPLRIANHVLARLPGSISADPAATTAPTGFVVCATK